MRPGRPGKLSKCFACYERLICACSPDCLPRSGSAMACTPSAAASRSKTSLAIWPHTTSTISTRCGVCWILWDQFQCAGEAWPHPDYAEVAPIGGQYPVDLATFRDRGHHPIDQSQAKVLESRIEFEGTDNIGGGRWLVFVARPRVENLGDQLAHRGPVLPQKVVDLREDESGYDDQTCGGQIGRASCRE